MVYIIRQTIAESIKEELNYLQMIENRPSLDEVAFDNTMPAASPEGKSESLHVSKEVAPFTYKPAISQRKNWIDVRTGRC